MLKAVATGALLTLGSSEVLHPLGWVSCNAPCRADFIVMRHYQLMQLFLLAPGS